MSPELPLAGSEASRCQWILLRDALRAFVLNATGHQGQAHIRPLHYYVSSRLVLEGGFNPDDITPRPPFVVDTRGSKRILIHDPAAAGSGERTVLGGLKTKAVDVVVTKPGVGPVVAVSMKGTLGAFRNLTNRMEEAIGDCTNLHISYPALVYGFLQLLRATRAAPGVELNDVCLGMDGKPVASITRYHDVMARLEGRRDLRDETTKYEAVALSLVVPDGARQGTFSTVFPPHDSPLSIVGFFAKLYRAYDLRFVYAAPKLESVTARVVWDEASPALRECHCDEYRPRVGPAER
ncbi:MAG TPA: hypothetical protein VMW75_14920 [Thermoanaerobaculia bacterium]|nr:hypothetical protein [Thermoanaerobaculia bacterium]